MIFTGSSLKKANIPEEEVHLHICLRYKNRKVNVYHNWKHEWILSAQNYEKIQQGLNGDYETLEEALFAAINWVDEDLKLSKPRFIAKIKKIPSNSFTFLCYGIGMIPGVSCLVAVYWFYRRNDRDRSLESHRRLTCGIYISAFVTLFGILYVGIESFLFFIPYSWGTYGEDGEWMSYRGYIAALLSLFASIFIAILFEKHERLINRVKYLEKDENGEDF